LRTAPLRLAVLLTISVPFRAGLATLQLLGILMLMVHVALEKRTGGLDPPRSEYKYNCIPPTPACVIPFALGVGAHSKPSWMRSLSRSVPQKAPI
jgi:hypothetical protein